MGGLVAQDRHRARINRALYLFARAAAVVELDEGIKAHPVLRGVHSVSHDVCVAGQGFRVIHQVTPLIL